MLVIVTHPGNAGNTNVIGKASNVGNRNVIGNVSYSNATW